MNRADFEAIANAIDKDLSVHFEDEFVYFLYPDPTISGNILLQELEGNLVVWSDEYKLRSVKEVYDLIFNLTAVDLIFPFIETKEEYDVVMSYNASQIDFVAEGCEDYSREFGSFLVKRN